MVRALVTVAALVLAVLVFGVPMGLVPVPFAAVGMGPVVGAGDEGSRQQLHPALRTAVGVVADDFRVHRAGVHDRPLGDAYVHLGDERKRLVRRRVEVGRKPLPFSDPVGVGTQNAELLLQRWYRLLG